MITVELSERDVETIRSAVEMMADEARCGGGFDSDDWDDVKRVLQKIKHPLLADAQGKRAREGGD